MHSLKNTLTVDPGFGGTGWAFWKGDDSPLTGVFKPEDLMNGFALFDDLLTRMKPELAIIEDCEVWGGSGKSVAAVNSGALFVLQALLGGYAGICFSHGIAFQFIKAKKWKGQLPDTAVDKRIFRINGQKYRHHESSAVGIGFSIAGVL